MKQDERTPGLDDDETLVRRWSEWAKTARRGGPIVVDRSILLRGIDLLSAKRRAVGKWKGNCGALLQIIEHCKSVGGTPSTEDAGLIAEIESDFDGKAVNAYTSTEALREALAELYHAVCGVNGFANAVREISGIAYPWPALDIAEEKARAALAGSTHASDCAVHNEPALPSGECDCGVSGSPAPSPDIEELIDAAYEYTMNSQSISASSAPSTEGLMLKIGTPVIIDDFDCPEARMVAVLTDFDAVRGVWTARYLSSLTPRRICAGHNPTPLSKFGVCVESDGERYRCIPTGEKCTATYPDGVARSWQDRSGREWWKLRVWAPSTDAARTALAPQPDIEELIVAAYERGFQWCVENADDPEAAAYVGKAARDYADKTMNVPSAGVTAPAAGGAK